MFNTIVVPLDGSTLSERALPYAEVLAQENGSRLVLLRAAPNGLLAEADAGTARYHSVAEAEAYLTAVRARIVDRRAPGNAPAVAIAAVRGDAADTILSTARERNADLVVMSTHGRSGLGRWLYGSVADQVLRQTNMPVLLIPAMCDYRWRDDHPLRVLVALDGSSHAEHALALAGELPNGLRPELLLLRVIEPPSQAHVAALYVKNATVETERYLLEQAQRLRRAGKTVTIRVRIGLPGEMIAATAREAEADLIAMATHGRGGLARLTLGSVATATLQRAGVPLLLVRPTAVGSAGEAGAEARAASTPMPVLARATAPPPTPATPAHAPAPPTAAGTAGLKASAIMTRPVITVRGDTTLEHVARTMLQLGIGCAPVVDAQGELQGIITESDFTGKEHGVPYTIIRAPEVFGHWLPKEGVEAIHRAARTLTARAIMTSPVITAREDDSVTSVVTTMIRRNVKHLPVVRDGVPIGIVARHDLLRLMAAGTDDAPGRAHP